MFSAYRRLMFRGKILELAIAVVIGAAFGTVVSAFVKDLLTPLIAAVVGKRDFSGFFVELNGSRLMYGDFINSLVSFFLVTIAAFVVAGLPMRAYFAHWNRRDVVTECPECLSVIRVGARRCSSCTAILTDKAARCPECMSEIPLGARRCAFCTANLKKAA